MNTVKISISGAVIIVLILVLRALLSERLPKRVFSILWLIAVLTLMLPFPFKTPFSLKYFSVEQNAAEHAASSAALPAKPADVPQGTAEAATAEESNNSEVDGFVLVRCAGAAAVACYLIVIRGRAAAVFKTSLPSDNAYITDWLYAHRLRRKIEVRISDKITTPLTYGILKPVILLPKNLGCQNRETLDYVLAHEFVHIKYFDNLYKLVLLATLITHWFNPFVWIMTAFASRDAELACDEAVLHMRGTQAKKTYAMLLIDLEEKRGALPALYSALTAASMKERIKSIMKNKKRTVGALIASGLLIGGLTVAYAAVSPAAGSDFFIAAVEEGDGSYSLDPATHNEYARWGIAYDGEKGAFYYNGDPIMLFEDSVETEPGMIVSKCSYYDPKGTVAIKTVRSSEENADGSINPFGRITEIAEMTQEEIDALILSHTAADRGKEYSYTSDQTAQAVENAADDYEETGMIGNIAEETAMIESYADLGLEYNLSVSGIEMRFHGRKVHSLYDETEGVWIADNMHGYALENSIDLEAVYENGRLAALQTSPCTHKDRIYAYADETASAWESTEEGTPLPDMFGKYEKYGIEYREITAKNGEQVRNLYYNGIPVNHFADISPDGSVFTFGSSEQSADGLELETVYKDGILSGVKES